MTSGGDLPTNGKLAETPLPKLLLDLFVARFSGALNLQREKTRKSIQIQKGSPVASESNLPSEQLGGQLRDAGRISQEAYDQVVAYVSEKQCKEGVALLSLQLLEPKDLFLALKEQVRQRLLACFAWPDGRFELDGQEAVSADVQPFRCDPLELVQTGLATHWGAERMLEGIAPHLNRYAQPTAVYTALCERTPPAESLSSLIAALDGSKTLGQAMGAKGSQPETLAAAWLLVTSGLVRLAEAPIGEPESESDEAPALDIEIEISGTEAASPAPASGGLEINKARSKPDGQDAEKSSQAEVLRAEILARLENLDELEHYAVLGVDSDAEPAKIKRAYLKAAKRYHPDSLARLALQDMKEQASEVFARMAEAYEVLSDSQKRAQYDDSLLDDGPEIDPAVIAQAETFFRKGEILVGMGDFRGALEYLENAVRIWPEENAYQKELGWAYYKKRPSEPEPARVHLEKAIELDPGDAVGHFRLSLVLRALGDSKAAEEFMARAKSLDPEVG